MEGSLPQRFMLTAAILAVIGMCLGIWMGTREDFTFAPVHAHINLVGWASMFLFGLWYKLHPAVAGRGIAHIHYWVALVGVVCLAIGIFGSLLPNAALFKVVIPGSLLTLVSMLIFVWNVARNR